MQNQNPVKIVLGVPGKWPTRSDIVTSIPEHSGGYLFLGRNIMDTTTGQIFELDVTEHDPNLERAFTLAGRGKLSKMDLTAIAMHTYTLYAIGPGGSLKAAQDMIAVAGGLLKAGGIAVKVESAGVAHSSQQWLKYLDNKDAAATLYEAYVTLIRGRNEGRSSLINRNETMYSCGMHNMGLRDAIVSINNSPETAAELLQIFLLYLLQENPQLKDGHTFSVSAKAPYYRLSSEKCTTFQPDDLFYNPFGVWRLSKI